MKLVRNTLLTLGISLIALLAGCVSYQPPPSVIHADNYSALNDNDQKASPPTDKVLTKEAAITIALENNPDYKTYQLNKIASFAVYYAALSAFSPTVSASWGDTITTGSSAITATGSNSSKRNNTAGNLAASYQAFSGFTTTFGALSARAAAMQAEWNVKDWRRQLVRDVIINYNTVLYNRAFLRIQQANERFQEQNATNSLLKYNAGADSLSTLLNWKIGRNQAKADAISAELGYKTSRYALAAKLGLTTADLPVQTEFPEISVPEADEFELGVEFYLDIAIAQRPDLKAQKESLKAAKYNLYSAWGAFSPTLDLTGNYGYSNTADGTLYNPIRMGGASGNSDINYGFAFNWNVWQGGSRIFNVRQQEALYDVQKQALLSKWISIVQDVRTYYVTLLANVARRKVLQQAREMALQRRDLVQEEYDAGNVDIATLNQAQQQLVSTRQTYVQSTIDVSNSRAQLYAACGVEE